MKLKFSILSYNFRVWKCFDFLRHKSVIVLTTQYTVHCIVTDIANSLRSFVISDNFSKHKESILHKNYTFWKELQLTETIQMALTWKTSLFSVLLFEEDSNKFLYVYIIDFLENFLISSDELSAYFCENNEYFHFKYITITWKGLFHVFTSSMFGHYMFTDKPMYHSVFNFY